jgi:hypothetical protein
MKLSSLLSGLAALFISSQAFAYTLAPGWQAPMPGKAGWVPKTDVTCADCRVYDPATQALVYSYTVKHWTPMYVTGFNPCEKDASNWYFTTCDFTCTPDQLSTWAVKMNVEKIKKFRDDYLGFLLESMGKVAVNPSKNKRKLEKKAGDLEINLSYGRGTKCCGDKGELPYAAITASAKASSADFTGEWNFPLAAIAPGLFFNAKIEGKIALEATLPKFTTDPCAGKVTSSDLTANIKPTIGIKGGPSALAGLVVGRGTSTVSGNLTIPCEVDMTDITVPTLKPKIQELTYEFKVTMGFEICALYDATCASWTYDLYNSKKIRIG